MSASVGLDELATLDVGNVLYMVGFKVCMYTVLPEYGEYGSTRRALLANGLARDGIRNVSATHLLAWFFLSEVPTVAVDGIQLRCPINTAVNTAPSGHVLGAALHLLREVLRNLLFW